MRFGDHAACSPVAGSTTQLPDLPKPLAAPPAPYQESVAVLGYPIGGDSLAVSAGVVSRVQMTHCEQAAFCALDGQPANPPVHHRTRHDGLSASPTFAQLCQITLTLPPPNPQTRMAA